MADASTLWKIARRTYYAMYIGNFLKRWGDSWSEWCERQAAGRGLLKSKCLGR